MRGPIEPIPERGDWNDLLKVSARRELPLGMPNKDEDENLHSDGASAI